MQAIKDSPPSLIVVGGFAGSGKTTVSHRLSADWRIPRLGADTIGRTITTSAAVKEAAIDAYWIAYDVLFALCEDFLRTGNSVILDLNMGWEFQWRQLDVIKDRHREALVLPIILRCPRELCVERTRLRYVEDPVYYDPPGIYTTDPKILKVADFLDRLRRPDIYFVDAARAQDEVYEEVTRYLMMRQRMAR